jgi:hypothetical protein
MCSASVFDFRTISKTSSSDDSKVNISALQVLLSLCLHAVRSAYNSSRTERDVQLRTTKFRRLQDDPYQTRILRINNAVLGATAKLRRGTSGFVMSVCPSTRKKTWLPLGRFSLNFIFEYFFENLSKKVTFH